MDDLPMPAPVVKGEATSTFDRGMILRRLEALTGRHDAAALEEVAFLRDLLAKLEAKGE
jgi:hypothetical protein